MEDLNKAIDNERIYHEKLRKRSGELAEELEGILGRIEIWDI